MFVRRSEPILLTEDGLDGLCASLNRPVVDIEDLPVGPARAVIALHRDAQGRRGLSLALRAEDSGAVTLFAFRGEVAGAAGPAMDAGLAFAESMGFLFDDDMLASGDLRARAQALACWYQLTGDDPPVGSPEGDHALVLDDLLDPLDEFAEELDLEPLSADPLLSAADPVPAAAAPDGDPAAAPAGGARVLTKFRRAAEAPGSPADDSSEDADGASARLGRIPIVRRRADEPDPVPALLTRLLARF